MRERERQRRQGYSKWVAFAQAGVRIFQRSNTMHVEIHGAHQQSQSYDTPFLFVGNNRYEVAGLEIGARTALDRGTLWVCAAPHAGRFKLFALAVQALLGLVRDADLAAFESERADVRVRRRKILVATDGEVTVMQTPLHYCIRPGPHPS